MIFWVGILLGFVLGVIVDSVDTYFTHRPYFDKLRERENWKKSDVKIVK
jgi:ABC-type enterochelin transport system permease subunit